MLTGGFSQTQLLGERSINGCSADLERLGNRRRTDTFGLHLLDLCGIDARLAPLEDAARLRAGYSFKLALSAQVGFKLREHAKHVEEALDEASDHR